MQTGGTWIDELISEIGYNFSGISSALKGDGYELFSISKYPNVYIIDSKEGRAIASDPSIVGDEFDRLNTALSINVARVMSKIGLLDNKSVFLDVLRAAPGYRLYEGMVRQSGDADISRIALRPKYVRRSYQAHVFNELEIIYSDLTALPEGHVTLFKPDTEASGKTTLATLEHLLGQCDKKRCTIDRIVLYGFISESGLLKIASFLKERGIELYAFAIEDLTALSDNGYDMPLYGMDKGAMTNPKLIKSLAPYEVVNGMGFDYYPGLDQPGDWSERQSRLFTGSSYEAGGIINHLQMTLRNLSELKTLSEKQSWYRKPHDDIYMRIIKKIEMALQLYS